MHEPSPLWRLDPDDPRAPSREVWERMSEAERQRVVDELPSDFPVSESSPPEGDHHYQAYSVARETLNRWFKERGRSVYISGNLPVYYPGERMFAPDVVAVVDVDPHQRESWIVNREGNRGLDFALEVIVSGRRRKDLKDNVIRYASLGIAEYFVYDYSKKALYGYRLPADGKSYQRMVPQEGRYASAVLGLDLSLEAGRLRFSVANAPLLDSGEVLSKLGALVNDAEARAIELEAALEEEQRRREEEQRRREEAEAEVALLREKLAELERRQRE